MSRPRGRPRTQPATCAHPACTAPPRARGLCGRHYQEQERRAIGKGPPARVADDGEPVGRLSVRLAQATLDALAELARAAGTTQSVEARAAIERGLG